MNQNLGHLIKCVNDKIKSKADADMKSRNLTLSQGRILAFLYRNGGEAMQKDIESFLDIAHPTVGGIITRMERNGYVICVSDSNDKRKKIVRMSQKATEARKDIMQKIEENEKAMLKGLSKQEIESLKHMLNIIYNNL